MSIINGLDTNDQSGRADLRKQGYFIDNSGAYSPGAGARVGDTWSGGNSSKNTPDDGHRLPISSNGTPISPSNGFTGPQTGAIMYRGDPQYSSLFGIGTPGFSSAPTPWAPGGLGSWNHQDPGNYLGGNPSSPRYQAGMQSAAGQTPYADWLTNYQKTQGQQQQASGGSPSAPGGMAAADGQTLASQSPDVQAAFQSVYGASAAGAWVQQHNAALGRTTSPSMGRSM